MEQHELSGARIRLSAQGLEWFLYNRTAAFDIVVAQMQETSGPSRADDEACLNVDLHKEDSPMDGKTYRYIYTLGIDSWKKICCTHLLHFPPRLPFSVRHHPPLERFLHG
jgi:hypothetical protein